MRIAGGGNAVMISRASISTGLLVCQLFFTTSAIAKLTTQEVESLVKSESKWAHDNGLSAKVLPGEIRIHLYREYKSTDRDLKVDSILIARKIMENDPDVKRVDVRFYDQQDRKHYDKVVVRQTDVAAYSSGVVTQEALLGGIDVEKGADIAEVVEGPLQPQRLALKRRVDALREQRVGVSTFAQLLVEADELAGKIQSDKGAADAPIWNKQLTEKVNTLTRALDDHDAETKRQKERELSKHLQAIQQASASQSVASAKAAAVRAKSAPPVAPLMTSPDSGTVKLGAFSPAPGPYLLDRIFIAYKLVATKKQNIPVSHLVPIWYRMERAAKAKDELALKSDIDYLQKQLGLPPVTDEQRRDNSVIQIRPF